MEQQQDQIKTLMVENKALEHSYTEEIKKSHALKVQVIQANEEILILKNKINDLEKPKQEVA